MPQATNLRLLLSSANHHYRHPLPAAPPFYLKNLSVSNYLPILLKTHKPQNIFSNLSSLPYHTEKIKKHSHAFDRNRSSLHKSVKTKEDIMEEKDGNARGEPGNFGFNRKRAEGRDGSDRPKKNLHLKVRKLNPANTISYVQILGTGMDTQDTSPSVLLFFDKQRFIFNAGEGLQRFCSEHKIKLSKIDHIFLSRVCSETAGGLPGLLLTLAGMGDEGMSVNVWGSSDLKYLVDAMKLFIPNAAMVHTRSFGPTPDSNGSPRAVSRAFDAPFVLIDDEVVKISAVLLKPAKEKSNDPNSSQAFDHAMKPGDVSVIYICELPEIKGKFDPQKAAALGLRPGPKFRELQLGNSVKSDRRDIEVHPRDVMGSSLPGPIVLLVDCPTLSHFEELSSRQCLASYHIDTTYDVPEGSKLVNCVIHLTPACITQTTDYQTWMMKFGAAQHIMAGHEMKNIEVPILKASARIAARLNYLCPRVFPSPGIWSLRDVAWFPPDPHKNLMSTSTQMIPAENLLKFHLRPYANLGLDRSAVPSPSSPSSVIDELLSEIPEVLEASKQVSHLWSESDTRCQDMSSVEKPCSDETSLPSCLDNISREEAEIVLLGTGSSQPSKYRNVSSIFINLFARGGVLLDCGEGTLGQLKRRFGVHGADKVVKNLKCIWISHIHADHHTGLARILALRRALLKELPHEPIVVVGPRQLKRFLDAYQRLEDLDMQFVDCWLTTEPSSLEDMESCRKIPEGPTEIRAVRSLRDALLEAGLEGLVSFPVVHCPQAFGVSLRGAGRREMVPGWKIVYSGDTRPCPAIVEAARGATVLIHEATFEDGMADEAVARNHSTTKEAVEVGESAGAYRIILTHFSQRYPKIPVFDESHTHRTCIGFDLMSVNLADIHLLPTVVPFLKLLFKDENLDTAVVDESDDVDLADAPASSLF